MITFWNVIGAIAAAVLILFFVYGAAKLATAGILQARQDFEARRKALSITKHNKEH